MKEQMREKNEEVELNAKENKGEEKQENKQVQYEVFEIARVVEEGTRVEEMVEYVIIEAQREQAKADVNLGQIIACKSELSTKV